jgi:putative phosphoribosyl transferase
MKVTKETLSIPVEDASLTGDLNVPEGSSSLVIFSHGSGSSRLSSRNRYVAERLNRQGFATLLFDLLTPAEDLEYQNRFEIGLLTARLVEVTKQVLTRSELHSFDVSYFGASTGAASALGAAAELGNRIKAVVSRPDLAMPVLHKVRAATMLIVGSLDHPVIGLNQAAYERLQSEKRLVIVPGATHLFEEPGKLDEVADLAANWFGTHLSTINSSPRGTR